MPNRLHRFVVAGYVVMPEHLHLLLGEPERGNPSKVMQAIKQGFARRLLRKLRAGDNPRQGCLWDTALATGTSGRRECGELHEKGSTVL
jgi:REP element-mobilizing transposase RayT